MQLAKRENATILAESTDRYIRNPGYHSKDMPDLQATDVDLRELTRWAEGVTLTTLLGPDAPPTEVRSYQQKRGQAAKGRKGGRPISQSKLMSEVQKKLKSLPPA